MGYNIHKEIFYCNGFLSLLNNRPEDDITKRLREQSNIIKIPNICI